jgi:hypothetical protein
MKLGLSFAAGKISGKGHDLIGSFSVRGVYGSDSASLTKIYRSHTVEYEGRWDGQVLFGSWTITRIKERGEFELWPEAEELTLNQLSAETPEPALA